MNPVIAKNLGDLFRSTLGNLLDLGSAKIT